MKALRTSRGSVIVDAAICIPIFLIAFGLLISQALKAGYEAKLYSDICHDISSVSYLYAGTDADIDYLVLSEAGSRFDLYAAVYYRPFVGEGERDDEYGNVYVFPSYGEKYHRPGCSTMDYNNNYVVMTESDAKAAGYEPCKLCGEGGTDYFKK